MVNIDIARSDHQINMVSKRSLFLLISIAVLTEEVSSYKWFGYAEKSSACVGAKSLACTKHNLRCPRNQQIKINSAFYGFVQKGHDCPMDRTTCSERNKNCACEWYRGDCGLKYSKIDDVEVMRCSGQRSCSPTSATSIDNSKCNGRKYNPKNSYTEIDYECIKAQRIDPDDPNVIKGHQIVLNASKDYAYSYTVNSPRWPPVYFYQTNQQLEAFNPHGHRLLAGVEYILKVKFVFTIQPKSDILIILTGGRWYQADIQVRKTRHATDKIPTSTKTTHQRSYPSSKSTTPSTTISSRPETKTTKDAFDMGTKTTTEAFDMGTKTTTEAFDMEEVTRNIEDEVIEKEQNDRMRPQASTAAPKILIGPIIAVIGGIVLLMIILVLVILLICKRRRRKNTEPVVVDNGVSNPGYEVSYVKPEFLGSPPPYEEIYPRNNNSGVLPVRTPADYNHLDDVMTNQRNDVIDAGLNVNELENRNCNDSYNHLQDVPKNP